MRYLGTLVLALVVLSVEAAASRVFGWSMGQVDITVALVTWVAIHGATVEGAFTAFSLGYLLDALSGRPTGLYAFLAVLLFVAVRIGNTLIDVRTRGLYAAATGVATLAHALLAAFFTWLTSRGGGQSAGLTGLHWQVLGTVVAAFLFFPLLKRLSPPQERQETGVLRA